MSAQHTPAPKLARRIEQWRGCDPLTMATKQSYAAIQNAFADAKHDILALHAVNSEMLTALRDLVEAVEDSERDSLRELMVAHAAIAKATGSQQ